MNFNRKESRMNTHFSVRIMSVVDSLTFTHEMTYMEAAKVVDNLLEAGFRLYEIKDLIEGFTKIPVYCRIEKIPLKELILNIAEALKHKNYSLAAYHLNDIGITKMINLIIDAGNVPDTRTEESAMLQALYLGLMKEIDALTS